MINVPPHISVVMATFNGELFLAAQINSILAQTIPPQEIIIVDDGSTDSTRNILQQYAEADKRFMVVYNEQNQGYINSFSKGMQLATSPFIALSDQDDIWVPHKLATMVEQIGSHLLIYSTSELIDAEGKSLHKKMSDIKNQIQYHSCLMYAIGAWAPGHAMLFKKELIQKCLPFPTLTTHDFWVGFVATCYSAIQYIPEPLVYYRQHTNNIIGANTYTAKKNHKPSREEKNKRARDRMQLLYEKCPAEKCPEEKQVLNQLNESFQNFSLSNNWKRMMLYFKYRDLMLAYKKKSAIMKWLYCFKMFFKID